MKEQDKQIFSMLQAFKRDSVLRAFELYQDGINNENEQIKTELKDSGYYPIKEKPDNQEFYLIDDEFWVQSKEARQAYIAKTTPVLKEAAAKKQRYLRTKKKTNVDLSQINTLVCSICGGVLYKQNVCPGCKDGKKGYRIRLICGENTNHEFLL